MYHAVAGGRPHLFILHPGIIVLLLTGEMQLPQCHCATDTKPTLYYLFNISSFPRVALSRTTDLDCGVKS